MKEHNGLKTLLLPFTWLYGLITLVRNSLYDRGILCIKKPHIFTISVGNLTVGGTGKTPMVEYLVQKLGKHFRLAILSRGYGRETRGLVFAEAGTTASDIGDEPLQYHLKYGRSVVVAVSENRVKGAYAIQQQFPDRNVLLLDDAYQHRTIGRDLNILLNDYNRPFYKDHPFPAGHLREVRSGAERADVVIVTKCPVALPAPDRQLIRKEIANYCAEGTPVFFSSVRYGTPVNFDNVPVSLNKVKLVAGIASPLPFLAFVKGRYTVMEEIIYNDHHNYNRADFEGLIKNLKSDTFVLTTEKDMVKLRPLALESGLIERFAFIPITVDFGEDSQAFEHWIEQAVKV